MCKEGLLVIRKPSVITLHQDSLSALQKSYNNFTKAFRKSNTKDKDSRQTFYIILLKEGVRFEDFLVMSYFSFISLFSDTGTKIE